MDITITVNPNDPVDVDKARAFLDRLSPPPDGDPLRDRIRSILKGYGPGRQSYVRLIASAAPERVPVTDILPLFKSPKGIGGTHSSIERSWRAAGGDGVFITTDRSGDSKMDAHLAAIALEVLDEIDAG